MKSTVRTALGLVFLCAACSESSESGTRSLYDFNKLIDTQIELLSRNNYILEKTAAVNASLSDTLFVPTASHWKGELDLFRQLEIINKPIYVGGYLASGPVKDSRSNLKIQTYSHVSAPLAELRFYYQDSPEKIRRIEAILSEANALYASKKTLRLEFEDAEGIPLLLAYSLDGFQKVALRDTVRFQMRGRIRTLSEASRLSPE
ncbi:MAG: hypothetical protein SH819_01020 [Cytophagales bacterium]|nr:hypothetical protein [Cytophagales bacterium]